MDIFGEKKCPKMKSADILLTFVFSLPYFKIKVRSLEFYFLFCDDKIFHSKSHIFFYGNNMETFGNQKLQKSCADFLCIYCDYSTSRRSSFNKHILSLKHKKVANQ